jgi:hypothetical protein
MIGAAWDGKGAFLIYDDVWAPAIHSQLPALTESRSEQYVLRL